MWYALLTSGEQDPSLRDQLLFDVSRYLLEFFDLLSQTLSQAYLDEQYQRQRWRDSLRYELMSIVFQFPEDIAAFQRTSEALGLDPTAPRIALALDLKLPQGAPGRLEGELDRLALGASRHLKCAYDDLVRVMHRDRLVIWVSCLRATRGGGRSQDRGERRIVGEGCP